MMTTKLNFTIRYKQVKSKLGKSAKSNNQLRKGLNRNTPFSKVNTLSKASLTLESLALGIKEGMDDAKAGRVYSQAKVERILGI